MRGKPKNKIRANTALFFERKWSNSKVVLLASVTLIPKWWLGLPILLLLSCGLLPCTSMQPIMHSFLYFALCISYYRNAQNRTRNFEPYTHMHTRSSQRLKFSVPHTSAPLSIGIGPQWCRAVYDKTPCSRVLHLRQQLNFMTARSRMHVPLLFCFETRASNLQWTG